MKLPFARTPINRKPATEPPTAGTPATRAPATRAPATRAPATCRSATRARARRPATRTLGAALVAVTMLLTACSGSPSTPDTPGAEAATTIRMGIQPWIGYGQWHVANDQGISAKHNIDVELTELTDDADQSAAFASGRIDMDNIASHTALLLMSQGIDLQIVAIEDFSTTADAILARGDITSAADLKGKRVAYEQGATSDLLLHAALASAGLTIDDIIPVPMGASEAGTALIGNRVDVAVTYEPYITAALASDPSVQRVYDAAQNPGLISDVLVTSGKFAAANPDAVRRAVAAWNEAADWYKANPEQGRAIISKAVGENPDALSSAFDGVQYYGSAENAAEFAGSYTTTTLPLVMRAAKEAGLLAADVDLSKATDPQYLG